MMFLSFDLVRNLVVALAIVLSILVLAYIITGKEEEE